MTKTMLVFAALAAAGCSAAVSPSSRYPSPLHAGARPTAHDGKLSPDTIAKKVDLLYISDNNGEVTVYTYWQRTLVGQLTGFTQPQGECVDKHGDVFITDYGAKQVVEYAHAGKKPIARIDDSPFAPYACSVDLATGTLAVANDAGSSSRGNIAIYANASGTPKLYTDENISKFHACAYDNEGNLLASDATNGDSVSSFAWLPKNGSRLVDVAVPGPVPSTSWEFVSGIQWDGRYWVLDVYNALFRVSVINAQAYYVGATYLEVTGFAGPFWIYSTNPRKQGTQVVGAYESLVEYWNYPAGGDDIGEIYHGLSEPVAVTVSLGKIHE